MAEGLKCDSFLEFAKWIVNTARNADESDKLSVRVAREKIAAIRAANPEFSSLMQELKGQTDGNA